MNRFYFLMLPLILFAAGCHGQATVTPQPTATVTDAAASCPSGYTCGYIVSRATCTSATACPTPASNGPYTPQQTTANTLPTPSFTDPAPPTGVYVAYTFQFVYLTGPGLTGPETGAASPNSTAQLIALYPATPGLSLANVVGGDGNQGKISGTPTTAGSYSFVVTATNAYGTANEPLTIVIENPAGVGGSFVFVG